MRSIEQSVDRRGIQDHWVHRNSPLHKEKYPVHGVNEKQIANENGIEGVL